jgi:broad specificity phosphatase PhoE
MSAAVVYLVRHATPDWSRTDLPYHIPPGPPLTPQGESEAAELGEFLRQVQVTSISGSPLERCWRTAQIAAACVGLAPVMDKGLTEIHPGEKPDEIFARIWPVWEQAVLAAATGSPVVLISHGGPIGVLLDKLGLLPEALDHYKKLFDRNNPLPPAGAWRAAKNDNGWQLGLAFTPKSYRSRLMI